MANLPKIADFIKELKETIQSHQELLKMYRDSGLLDEKLIKPDLLENQTLMNRINEVIEQITIIPSSPIFICRECNSLRGNDVVVNLQKGDSYKIQQTKDYMKAICAQGCPYCGSKELECVELVKESVESKGDV